MVIISILIPGIFSCNSKPNRTENKDQTEDIVHKIEVRKVECYILTIAHVDCDLFERWFDSSMEVHVIENPDSINLFMQTINKLERDNAPYNFDNTPDVRAKLLIYRSNDNLDTLCTDDFCMDNGRILLNGTLYRPNKTLSALIKNL
jgi:hypothetical protein